jgi:hypothetical protein
MQRLPSNCYVKIQIKFQPRPLPTSFSKSGLLLFLLILISKQACPKAANRASARARAKLRGPYRRRRSQRHHGNARFRSFSHLAMASSNELQKPSPELRLRLSQRESDSRCELFSKNLTSLETECGTSTPTSSLPMNEVLW